MLKQPVTVVNYTNVAIVRLKVNKEKFELACYKNKIKQYREKIESDINEVLQISEIFTNAVKGDKANKKLLEKVFPGMTKEQVVDLILLKGDIQVSDKERESVLSNLKNYVANVIAEKTFDLDTGMPYTQNVILQALVEVGANLKESDDAKKIALKFIKEFQEKKILNIERRYMKLSFIHKKAEKADSEELVSYLHSVKAVIENEQLISEFMSITSTDIENKVNKPVKLICLALPQYYKEIISKFEESKHNLI